MNSQLEIVLTIIRHGLPWRVIESNGTPVTHQPLCDMKNLLRVHASGIHVEALAEPPAVPLVTENGALWKARFEDANGKLYEIDREVEGYVDGAPDAGEASRLANRVAAIIQDLSPVCHTVTIERPTFKIISCPQGVEVKIVDAPTE